MMKLLLIFTIIFNFKGALANNNYIVASVDNIAITRHDMDNLKKMFKTNDVLEEYILVLKKRLIAINNNIAVTDNEKMALKSNRNDFLKQLKVSSKGLDLDFVDFIIESNYLWSKYIEMNVKPKIVVKDSYIDNVIEYTLENNVKNKYDLSEIVLYYNSENKIDIEKKIKDVYNKLNDDNFSSMATSLSQSLSAKDGGYIGWVFETDLNKNMINVIKNTKNISKPTCIGDDKGVCIIFKINNKEKIYNVSQDTKLQIRNFIFLQLLDSKVLDVINNTKFIIKYDYNK